MTGESRYDPAWTAAYYDAYGAKEWDRFSRTPVDQVSLYLHTHYLRRFVAPGSRVLEIGAGPGRFTQVLAGLDCRVVVGDLSEVQLKLHRERAAELGFEPAVERRLRLDICDLGAFDTDTFDAVVAYGGPLSYVFDRASDALAECVRVCRPGGHVLVSVMSLWGTCHQNLASVLALPPTTNRRITDSGDLSPDTWEDVVHRCHLFRADELRSLAVAAGLTVAAVSASGCLVIRWDESLADPDPASETWRELLRMELEASRQPGCLDMGTHIILVGAKPALGR